MSLQARRQVLAQGRAFENHLSLVDQGTHKYVGCSFSVLRVNTNLPRHFLIRKREREPGYEVVIVHART